MNSSSSENNHRPLYVLELAAEPIAPTSFHICKPHRVVLALIPSRLDERSPSVCHNWPSVIILGLFVESSIPFAARGLLSMDWLRGGGTERVETGGGWIPPPSPGFASSPSADCVCPSLRRQYRPGRIWAGIQSPRSTRLHAESCRPRATQCHADRIEIHGLSSAIMSCRRHAPGTTPLINSYSQRKAQLCDSITSTIQLSHLQSLHS